MKRTFDRPSSGEAALLVVLAGLLVATCGSGSGPSSATAPRTVATTSTSGPTATSSAVGTSLPTGSEGLPVAFRTGAASLTLTGSERATVELAEIVPSEDGIIFSGSDPVEGTSVSWRERDKENGWYLSVTGFFGTGAIATADPIPFLSLTSPDDRYVQDMAGRCTVNVTTSTRERFEGTIDCAGLAWLDEEDQPVGEPFDVKVTFSAAP